MKLCYDSDEDREIILKALAEIKQVDLPIDKMIISSIYIPEAPLYQEYNEEELKERGESSGFGYRTVELWNLEEIQSSNDLFLSIKFSCLQIQINIQSVGFYRCTKAFW